MKLLPCPFCGFLLLFGQFFPHFENRPALRGTDTGEAQFARRGVIVALLDPLRFLPATPDDVPGHHRPE